MSITELLKESLPETARMRVIGTGGGCEAWEITSPMFPGSVLVTSDLTASLPSHGEPIIVAGTIEDSHDVHETYLHEERDVICRAPGFIAEDILHAVRCAMAANIGRRYGVSSGSWVIDGNTAEDRARAIIKGYEDGDPSVLDMEPHPLSGEYADDITSLGILWDVDGDMVHDILSGSGDPEETEQEIIDAFCSSFSEGFRYEVIRAARVVADIDETED